MPSLVLLSPLLVVLSLLFFVLRSFETDEEEEVEAEEVDEVAALPVSLELLRLLPPPLVSNELLFFLLVEPSPMLSLNMFLLFDITRI